MSHPVFEAVRRISAKEAAERAGLVLARKGSRFWTCCPLHGEKTASLMFNEDGSWHCFGCNKGGDAIQLYAEMNDLGNFDAAVLLAQDFGIPVKENGRWIQLPSRKPTLEDKRRTLFSWTNQKLKELREEIRRLDDECCRLSSSAGSTWDNILANKTFNAALKALSKATDQEAYLFNLKVLNDIAVLVDWYNADRQKEAYTNGEKTTNHKLT